MLASFDRNFLMRVSFVDILSFPFPYPASPRFGFTGDKRPFGQREREKAQG
jgi:hypothetical protein